ncbi:hypothetical protein J3D55_002915 [Chryseobacterium ginsenosidimutans]|uniref:hypothetical protein n=1 Tax=Chryseobacterium ginsenosidimutans TaxID=687846 RepID=UPI0021688D2A|nr:hypothetical protein [Chryseobacterium ginsenosidimutans]MCS3869999.1 hypothetical protein [Chryseobacterium ginsenosidimutans]
MKIVTKIIGFFLIVLSFAYYDAAPLQRGHGHGRGHGPSKHYYGGPRRPHYRKVVYHRPPRHYYRRDYYRPVRHRYYSHRPHRVYHSRPVVVVRL